jgi:hypothetical protein
MLGLVSHFRRIFPQVGFFKPVGTEWYPHGGQLYPRNVVLMHETFHMKSDPASMYAVPEDEAFQVRIYYQCTSTFNITSVLHTPCHSTMLLPLWVAKCGCGASADDY